LIAQRAEFGEKAGEAGIGRVDVARDVTSQSFDFGRAVVRRS
jgi:hypothetical protein